MMKLNTTIVRMQIDKFLKLVEDEKVDLPCDGVEQIFITVDIADNAVIRSCGRNYLQGELKKGNLISEDSIAIVVVHKVKCNSNYTRQDIYVSCVRDNKIKTQDDIKPFKRVPMLL